MYRFKKEYADAIIVIPGLRLEVTAENLTDDKAKLILDKYPQFAHNFEIVPHVYEEDEEKPKRKRRTKEEIEADKANGLNEIDEDVDA